MSAVRRILASVVCCLPLLSTSANATNYYVSSRMGSDFSDGRSQQTPWKTIARVNRQPLLPGDSVLFRRGDLWRETLKPLSSGGPGKSITFGAFGSGPRPIISGSNPIDWTEWKREGLSLFWIPRRTPPTTIWRGNARMRRVADKGYLQDALSFFWDASARLYIRSSAGAPTDVEIQSRDLNIDNNEQSHIVFEELDLQHASEGLRVYSWKAAVIDVTLQDSSVTTETHGPGGLVSAGVYSSVNQGTISRLLILNNTFIPYPSELEHWGVYFVRGVSDFIIAGNRFGPAGEDAITVWHSANGSITRNRGGGNGENTIDVKDSHDVLIRDNLAENDSEYNIVVHSVDDDSTYNVVVEKNQCRGGGQGGHLSAGIALLFVRSSRIIDNAVEDAFGEGILVHDRNLSAGNEVTRNRLTGNSRGQPAPAIVLEGPRGTRVYENTITRASALTH